MNCDQVSVKTSEINVIPNQISILPKELWANCAEYLDMQDIAKLSKVSRYFAKIIRDTRFFILSFSDLAELQKQVIDKFSPILARILPNHLDALISRIGDDVINKRTKDFLIIKSTTLVDLYNHHFLDSRSYKLDTTYDQAHNIFYERIYSNFDTLRVLESIEDVNSIANKIPIAIKNDISRDKDILLDIEVNIGNVHQQKTDEKIEFFQRIPEKIKQHKNFISMIIENNHSLIEYAAPYFLNDQNTILRAIKSASDHKNDIEDILKKIFYYVSQGLKENPDFMLAAVKENWRALEYASVDVKNNKKVVFAAVIQNSKALQYASEKLQVDEDILMAAFKQVDRNIQYPHKKLEVDQETVRLAVMDLKYAYEKLYGVKNIEDVKDVKDIKDVIINAFKKGSWKIVDCVPNEMKKNKDFVDFLYFTTEDWGVKIKLHILQTLNVQREYIEKIKQGVLRLQDLSLDLQDNKCVVLAAVTKNGLELEFASDRLKKDRLIVDAAMTQNAASRQFAVIS